MTGVSKVLLAEPRGFCAGVEMAVKALVWMVRVFKPPVYCYHEIVHNRHIVDRFRQCGVVFVDDVSAVPEGAPLILSAHGSAPDLLDGARSTTTLVVDAVCPLVAKVHHEVRVRAQRGYAVVYVGHAGHDEAVGTMAIAPDATRLVQSPEDLEAALADDPGPVALLAQTTLSLDEWQDIREMAKVRIADLWLPDKSDLCFATTNRQAAVKALAQRSDAMVILGSANSSNTRALERVALAAGVPQVVRVDGAHEIPAVEGVVGVTAGASAPETLVREAIRALDPRDGVELVRVTEETEYFPPPRDLRRLLAAAGCDGVTITVDGVDVSADDDHDVSAEALLDALLAAQPAGAPAS